MSENKFLTHYSEIKTKEEKLRGRTRTRRDIKWSDICNSSISSMMFSLGQKCCSTMLEMRKHINVGCTKIESTLEVAFNLHCMGSDVEDMIHY